MIKIHPLTTNHISEIIHLSLTKWKQSNLLSSELYDSDLIEAFLTNSLNDVLAKHPGYGAFKTGKLVAYLLGYSRIPTLKGKEFGSYVPVWGHYISNNDFQMFSRLYSTLAKDWLENEVFTHIITSLSNQALLHENLYILGFGLLVIDAIRSMKQISNPPLASKFTLRPMSTDDYQSINHIEQDFQSYLQTSPTFLCTSSSNQSSPLSDFISDNRQTYIVEHQGVIVAAIRGVLGKSNFDLLSQPQSIAIDFAYTDPKFRGHGLGTHMVNEIIKFGQINQVSYCTVDFESANLLAKRFWLTHFLPIGYSSIRKIDNRL
ncbi:MAG: GNAT family N-acetyltransferase [Candidatus Heimdallarchaeota archaeon]